jgi:hypothetical protein
MRAFRATTDCHLCSHPLKDDGVRDHCHVTGRYRGAAHSKCNVRARTSYKVPVFLHNLKGYDAHHLLTAADALGPDVKLSAMAKNAEKFTTLGIGRIEFKDSMSFMMAGLGTLVGNLKPEAFVRTRAHILARHGDRSQEWRDEALTLLTRKGVYPYEHMTSYAPFAETQLPPIAAFTSSMSGDVTAEDYAHGQRVWAHWGCRTMRDYHDLYLLADVILLAALLLTAERRERVVLERRDQGVDRRIQLHEHVLRASHPEEQLRAVYLTVWPDQRIRSAARLLPVELHRVLARTLRRRQRHQDRLEVRIPNVGSTRGALEVCELHDGRRAIRLNLG